MTFAVRAFAFGVAAAASALAAGPAAAALIQYPDRIAYDAANSGAVETYDGMLNGTVLGTVGGVTYTTTGGSVVVADGFAYTTPTLGIGATNVGYFLETDTVTFSFANAITAFGIDINTFATADGDYSATTNLGDIASSFFDPFPGFSTGQFLGFSSDTPFTSVTLSTAGEFPYSLDTLRYTSATTRAVVPEPSSLLLFATALLAVFGFGTLARRARA